jgi:hypothetical protein
MFRRYNRWHSRFDQPDPSLGSYDLANPQSFNRYSYTQNDPVNFTDPIGLAPVLACPPDTDGVIRTCTWAPFLNDGPSLTGLWSIGPHPEPNPRGGGGRPNPQNPEVPLTPGQTGAIRDQIAGLLTDKCAKFIDQLISNQTGKAYDSKSSLLTDFNSIRDGKGGFFFGGTVYGGGASGSLANGNGKVDISNMFSFTDSNRAFGAAFAALHEIIHVIAGANDQQLSQQVQALGMSVMAYPGYTLPYPTDKDNRNLAYSGYWGQALKNACDPKGY